MSVGATALIVRVPVIVAFGVIEVRTDEGCDHGVAAGLGRRRRGAVVGDEEVAGDGRHAIGADRDWRSRRAQLPS